MNTIIVLKDMGGDAVSRNAMDVARILKSLGDVHIVTFGKGGDYNIDGINIHEVDFILQADNIFNWIMLLNNEFKKRAVELNESVGFDIIHVHDWTAGPAGMTLSKYLNIPLVATFHSTEHQRGFGSYVSQIISDVEWWLAYESQRILVTDNQTRLSLIHDLKVPGDKIFDSTEDNIKSIFTELGEKK